MHQISADGFAILSSVVDEGQMAPIIHRIEHLTSTVDCLRQAGLRNPSKAVPEIAELSQDEILVDIATAVLGKRAYVVRTLFFDKTPDANWKVAWHQDLTIAVRERHETPGFGPWSLKDGIPHVQPPAEVLSRMITLRVHLDDCTAENGALRVLPGSHLEGRLSPDQICKWRERVPEVTCEVPRGGVLLMRPLLLHASSPAEIPRHRRVLHFEFAAEELPEKLAWYESPSSLNPAAN